MLTPPLPDKAGRGALCQEVDKLEEAIKRVMVNSPHADPFELKRLFHRLDSARSKFHALYGKKER